MVAFLLLTVLYSVFVVNLSTDKPANSVPNVEEHVSAGHTVKYTFTLFLYYKGDDSAKKTGGMMSDPDKEVCSILI